MPLLIHLAETKDEIKIIKTAHHTTPARFLDALGVWDGRSLAAHAVWLDDADMDVLAKKQVGLAHNPESNMKLASGVARGAGLDRARRSGPAWAPTAPPATTTSTCSRRCAQPRCCTRCRSGNPQAMPAAQALELATRRGAEALGMADRIGSLEPGKQADVITVDVRGARQTPMFDPISHLVYVSRGDDVRNDDCRRPGADGRRRVTYAERRNRCCSDARAMADARAGSRRARRLRERAARVSKHVVEEVLFDETDDSAPHRRARAGDPPRLRRPTRRSISSPC